MMEFLKISKKFCSKVSFVQKELNKFNKNTIGNAYQTQMYFRRDYYDYDRLYYNLLDSKLAKQEAKGIDNTKTQK
jgi:hypothetical protein